MKLTMQYENITEDSLFRRKDREKEEFVPVKAVQQESAELLDYVPKPLYTKSELDEFRRKNTREGRFVADASTVHSVEDLEKLMFIWNETVNDEEDRKIIIEDDINGEGGFRFSKIVIEDGKRNS